MEISINCNSVAADHIATKFCTFHDSTVVVSCAKYCSDHIIKIWMRTKLTFRHIWILIEKLLVKWAPDLRANVWVRISVNIHILILPWIFITSLSQFYEIRIFIFPYKLHDRNPPLSLYQYARYKVYDFRQLNGPQILSVTFRISEYISLKCDWSMTLSEMYS